jgi:hypothetical protein
MDTPGSKLAPRLEKSISSLACISIFCSFEKNANESFKRNALQTQAA